MTALRLASFDASIEMVGEDLDLIVDDGLHTPNANLAALRFGMERVRVGGSVIIEDIAPAAVPIWQVVGALLPPTTGPRWSLREAPP